jgi:Legionella pneumophila major outer membrane protein precursor
MKDAIIFSIFLCSCLFAKDKIKEKGELYFKGKNIEWKTDASMCVEFENTKKVCNDPCNDKITYLSANVCSYENPLKCGHMFIEGGYLYWKAKVPLVWGSLSENLSAQNPNLPSNTFSNRKLGVVNMSPHSGYRVGFGFYLPPCGWTTSFTYTQFMAKGTDFLTENGDTDRYRLDISWSTFPIVQTSVNFPGGPSDASTTQQIRLKLLDWILEKSIFWKSCFNFNPFFGFRYAWIKNDLNILNKQMSISNGIFGSNSIDLNNHFRAFGIRFGLKMNWLLGCGFELFGNAALSGLWGKYDLRDRESIFRVNLTDPIIDLFELTSHKKIYMAKPIFEFLLGLNWGKIFCRNRFYLGIKTGYEISIYPNQIILNTVGSFALPTNVDQTIHGLTTALRFDF